MTTGIAIPFTVNPAGGVKLVYKDDNDAKIIRVALSDGDSENAYQQDITLGQEVVFQPSDSSFRSWVATRLNSIFRSFQAEKRFRLLTSTISWEDVEDSGESILSFRYVNLESDEEKEFEHAFAGSQ